MEKVQVFLDYANINRGASDLGYDLNYGNILHEILANESEGRFLIDAFAYVPIDPRQEHKMDSRMNELWNEGYLVNSKVGTIAGEGYKCDVDVEMTMDVMKIAMQTKPDIIVLMTGDSDFIPLVKELRRMGIRVEVASFQGSISKHLSKTASGFIDLGYYFEADEKEKSKDLEENLITNEEK